MRFGLGATVSKVAAVIGVAARGISYLKDNLKIYFDFKSDRAKTLEFVGTGSVYFTTDDYINCGAPTITGYPFSVSAWFKLDDTTTFESNIYKPGIAKFDLGFLGFSSIEII